MSKFKLAAKIVADALQAKLQKEVNEFNRDEDNQEAIERRREGILHERAKVRKQQEDRAFNSAMAKQLIS
jgi:hypothetical protein